MQTIKTIKRALISVYYKDGLEEIVKELAKNGVEILSTGGTYDFIQSLSIPVKTVESVTGYPSILGGRVKTLHPKVFGGILNRRDNTTDQNQIAEYDIPSIDLVIVDLYPFEEYVAAGASKAEIIEKIDTALSVFLFCRCFWILFSCVGFRRHSCKISVYIEINGIVTPGVSPSALRPSFASYSCSRILNRLYVQSTPSDTA